MTLENVARTVLFIDIVGISALLILAWQDLRRQTGDVGRVGGVLAVAALCFVLYLLGRAFIGA